MTPGSAKALVATLEAFIRIVSRDATVQPPFSAAGLDEARSNLAAAFQLADTTEHERAVESMLHRHEGK